MVDTEFIVDPQFADWVWDQVQNSPRVNWVEDQRLQYKVAENVVEDTMYYREGGNTYEGLDFTMHGGFGAPDFAGSPKLDFLDTEPSSVMLAATTYTDLGSWFTFEFKEDNPGSVYAMFRVPVPQSMKDEVREWAERHDGEMVREKGVEFQERFAEVLPSTEARRAVGDLWDLHVRFSFVESESEMKQLVRDALDFAERGVRAVT